jgi:acetolactate synthase-1/2/3 large subunit
MAHVTALARRLGAPILTTPDAKSILDERSDLAGGVFSFGATARARAIVEAADLVVAVGTNLGEFASKAGNAFDHAAILHVTDDPGDLHVGLAAVAVMVGDVAAGVEALVTDVGPGARAGRWFDALHVPAPPPATARPAQSDGIDPADAVRALGEALPARARVACDVTSAALHVLHGLELDPDRRLWLQIERSACMGTALAVGLGVRIASDLSTMVVIGDWGFMMGGGTELHTAAVLGVGRFVVVVWSNAGGALIRSGVRAQRIDVPAETHSWAPPRFARVAKGYGVRAVTVRSARGLRRAAAVAMQAPYPVLIDAVIQPEAQIPGAGDRYVHLDTSTRAS